MDQGRGLSAVRNLTNGPGSAASFQFLVFLLGEQRYALPLAVVKRIERVVAVTALPGAPEVVLGAVNVHGDVAPVFDLHRRFGLPLRDPELTDRLIVAKTSHRLVAFLADAVQGVLKRSADQVIPAERVLPGLEYIRGVILLDDGIILIQDLEKFLSPDEEAKLEQAMERQ